MSRTASPTWVGPDKFSPIVALPGRLDEPVRETSFDCVQLGFIRAGSAMIAGDFPSRQVGRGDVVAFAPVTPCRVKPGPDGVDFTTVFVDEDLLVDSVAWQYAAHLRNRHEAQTFVSSRYLDKLQAVGIGEPTMRQVEPWLDELQDLSANGLAQVRFKRAVSVLFAVLDAIESVFEAAGPALLGQPGGCEHDLTLPRPRLFEPLRPEAARTAELLRSEPEHMWTLAELARQVDLSPNHLRQLFVDSFGRSPWDYQNMLRAQRMAILLQDPGLSIPEAMRRVGWSTPSHAAKMFRRYAGMSPRDFRNRSVTGSS